MTRPIRASALTLVTIVIVALVAACSSSATPGPSGASGGNGLGGGLGGALQSLGAELPSNPLDLSSLGLNLNLGSGSPGTLNGAPDLEALLPSTLCNQPAQKSSVGAGLASALPDASLDPMIAAFGALGGGSANIALSEPTSSDCNVSVFAYQVPGAQQNVFTTIISMLALSGGSTTTIGGKAVTKIPDTPTSTYLYVKGDTVFAVSAPTDDEAAPVLQGLP
ncbi:MAG TPA: hypothetical protein VEG29_07945 [Candidatus Binatia bacterium]|nr:hypothetical protein [Candidatus Binatia bacterium]